MQSSDRRVEDEAFEAVLSGHADEVTAVARAARDLIRELDPDVVEVAWPRQGSIGFGIGPRKFTEHYVYLVLHAHHVSMGFNQGAELPDPEGLLSGPGKSLRALRLTPPEVLAGPALRELLVRAREHRTATTHSSGGPAKNR